MYITRERKISLLESTALLLLWALVFVSPLLFGGEYIRNWRAVNTLWVQIGIMFFAFVVNRYLLMPYLFFHKRYALYVILVVILICVISIFLVHFDGVNYLLDLIGSPPRVAVSPRIRVPQPVIPPNISIMTFTTIIILLDMGLNIAVKWIVAEQRESELQSDNMRAQLSNLQNQVSPHFFMNTLNNIHALVGVDPEKAQATIIELSGLMDYLLYESSNLKDVSLQRELDFVRSYVSLMRLRYPKRVDIELICSSDIPKIKVPPLLSLNFIENAFKYGVNYSHRSFIRIEIGVSKDNYIEISVCNSNHSATVKTSRRGLGVANSRKRLDLIYGNSYFLNISDNDDIYEVNLKIPII